MSWRYIASRTEVAGLRPSFDADTSEVFRLLVVNNLILYLTLGIGHPLIQHRLLVFMADRLRFDGVLEAETTGQNRMASPRFGEGALEIFG